MISDCQAQHAAIRAGSYTYTVSADGSESCADSSGYTPGVPTISGQWIVTLRERKQLSQAELAKTAKISASKLSRIENDKPENPRLTTVERIAHALDVSVGELFTPRLEGETGRDAGERNPILDARYAGLLSTLDSETPAQDSWRGDVLKAIAALTRALRREDPGESEQRAANARR